MGRSITKLLFTLSVITVSLLFIAISCDKGGLTKDDVNNLIASNNNSGNSGGSGSGNVDGNNAAGGNSAIGGGGGTGSGTGGSSGSSGSGTGSSGLGSVITTGGDSASTTLAGCTYRTIVPCISVGLGRYAKTKKDPANPANENIIYVNAAGIGAATEPISDTSDANRGYHNVPYSNKEQIISDLFTYFPKSGESGTPGSFIFINRTHVTTNTITFPTLLNKTGTQNCLDPDSETAENNLAKKTEGAHCRLIKGTHGIYYGTTDYLGTVFNNSDRTKARGMMACDGNISTYDPSNPSSSSLADTSIFTLRNTSCFVSVVNDGRGKNVTIDDAWVSDPNSTTEMEFRIIAINVERKPITEFLPASENFTAAKFQQQIDNATFKKLLSHNESVEATFKIKLVTKAVFDAL